MPRKPVLGSAPAPPSRAFAPLPPFLRILSPKAFLTPNPSLTQDTCASNVEDGARARALPPSNLLPPHLPHPTPHPRSFLPRPEPPHLRGPVPLPPLPNRDDSSLALVVVPVAVAVVPVAIPLAPPTTPHPRAPPTPPPPASPVPRRRPRPRPARPHKPRRPPRRRRPRMYPRPPPP